MALSNEQPPPGAVEVTTDTFAFSYLRRGYLVWNGSYPHDDASDEERMKSADAYARFAEIRGRIVNKAIEVEMALSAAIAEYFVPRLLMPEAGGVKKRMAMDGPTLERQYEFMVVGLRDTHFRPKLRMLAQIARVSQVPDLKKHYAGRPDTAIRKAVQPVIDMRNQYAHSIVGIDFDTGKTYFPVPPPPNNYWTPIPEDERKGTTRSLAC